VSVELVVILPVYNEGEAIAAVLEKWHRELSSLQIRFEIYVYDDGSSDDSPRIIDRFAETHLNVVAHHKVNAGHGPTILAGYRHNANRAPWMFQVDSDDIVGSECFSTIWAMREQYDFLVGRRSGPRPLARQIISLVSRLVIRAFYGEGIWDVNSPYRLMRTERFRVAVEAIPPDTFAPNLIVSGYAARRRLRILEVPVRCGGRTTGEVSLKKWRLFKAAALSCAQTIRFAFVMPERNR
jgi:glycosyltransferase involved in cell wall biosynthesis